MSVTATNWATRRSRGRRRAGRRAPAQRPLRTSAGDSCGRSRPSPEAPGCVPPPRAAAGSARRTGRSGRPGTSIAAPGSSPVGVPAVAAHLDADVRSGSRQQTFARPEAAEDRLHRDPARSATAVSVNSSIGLLVEDGFGGVEDPLAGCRGRLGPRPHPVGAGLAGLLAWLTATKISAECGQPRLAPAPGGDQ